MSRRCVLELLLALTLCGAAFPLACASASVATSPPAREPSPAVGPSSSVSAAPPPPASAAAVPAPVASASEAPPPAPPPSAEPTPPCIDGEIMMGTCICSQGKTADESGHCVSAPCPTITAGGTPFRDQATGQCKECRAGTKPTSDGKCQPY